MQFKKNQKDNNKNIAETQKTVYVFIDASNIWQAQKAKGKFFDYDKLKIFLKNKFKALEINMFYYTAYPAQGTRVRPKQNNPPCGGLPLDVIPYQL